ncbi:MAG: DUF4920 domain-containing protein [Bryobacter sp.]|nr:DUF4920 domain-containing protein [Bryobacter sp.]
MRLFFILLALSALAFAADQKLGKPLTLKEAITVDALMAAPEKHVGKLVQVEGRITEVCQMMGCWMSIVDPHSGKAVRIKVNDGEIEFPKDGRGRRAIAEGTLTKLELSKERAIADARHEAEEMGRKFDASKITGPVVRYQIRGTGAVILD